MISTIRLAADQKEIEEFIQLANKTDDFEGASEPSALDSNRALNAGLTADDVKTLFEIATIAFKTGKALFDFLKSLRDYLRARGGSVGISDPARGKPIGKIDGGTDDKDIETMIES
jgi:hypothetical protein